MLRKVVYFPKSELIVLKIRYSPTRTIATMTSWENMVFFLDNSLRVYIEYRVNIFDFLFYKDFELRCFE